MRKAVGLYFVSCRNEFPQVLPRHKITPLFNPPGDSEEPPAQVIVLQ
jgi:hypothetical protein